jgi:hypothetical protein
MSLKTEKSVETTKTSTIGQLLFVGPEKLSKSIGI